MSKLRQPLQGDECLLMRSYAVTHPRNVGIGTRCFRDWDQLAYAAEGVMTVHAAAAAWVVLPHRALWIPAGAVHLVQTSGRVTLRTLFLRPSLSRGRLPRSCVALGVTVLVRELVVHAAERNTLRRDRPADRRLAHVLIDQLATLPHEPVRLPTPCDPRARAAAEHIQHRPADALPTVAHAAAASVRTLGRAFLRETGLPLGRWRRRAACSPRFGSRPGAFTSRASRWRWAIRPPAHSSPPSVVRWAPRPGGISLVEARLGPRSGGAEWLLVSHEF
jgi:AraC-like DNA-binding protein